MVGLKTAEEWQDGFIATVEGLRLQAAAELAPEARSSWGQYFTPLEIATLMASMAPPQDSPVNILDPGAGSGMLAAAVVNKLLKDSPSPRHISVTAYEIDQTLHSYLEASLNLCAQACAEAGVEFAYTISSEDFIEAGVRRAILDRQMGLFEPGQLSPPYDLVIANPPYKKIASESRTRKTLQRVGLETSNLYSAFIAVALMLLKPQGHLVAITPRSFCNGSYFKPFREFLLENAVFHRIHLFGSREEAFSDDEVLQENIIFHLSKDNDRNRPVVITASDNPSDEAMSVLELPHGFVISETDPNKFIHIVSDKLSQQVIERMAEFGCSLDDLGIQISTGRVVDFRAPQFLRLLPGPETVPLLYPLNLQNGSVYWPQAETRKPQAILRCAVTEELLVENGIYVLTKRFTSKEQPKRVVAALYQPEAAAGDKIGFENHLNYFHRRGTPLGKNFAVGLATFLNSTLVDLYFRVFSGHTQVNATDLRAMKYPTSEELEELGRLVGDNSFSQAEIDQVVERILLTMSDEVSPVSAIKKIEEAISILKQLGLPRTQQNERSGLTLLALLDLKPNEPWSDARSPLVGITEMMNFFEAYYGKRYAPNTRETVRRFTVHQFMQAGIVVPNPDQPRPINSPGYVYQIEPGVLKLIREFGTAQWDINLPRYLASLETLREKYTQVRQMHRIAISISEDIKITLSPGGQNVLIKQILDEFCSRFTPGGKLIYLGDTEAKWAYFDRAAFEQLGLTVPDEHGKIPDIVVYYSEKNWLVLIEAVTSHGPINPKRKIELEELFAGSKAGLVFVTAFLTRRALMKYLNDIAWETEVWVAETPDHVIHFNGERFLGPYQ
jgi:adenine-specific DNA-methyltransferase